MGKLVRHHLAKALENWYAEPKLMKSGFYSTRRIQNSANQIRVRSVHRTEYYRNLCELTK